MFLKSRRLELNPLTEREFTPRYLAWLNDPEVNRYSRRRLFPSTPDAMGAYGADNTVLLGIFLKDGGRHVGNISLGPINWPNRWADIRILLGDRSVWGEGIGTEAIYTLTRHGFRTMGLNRIEAASANPAFNRVVVDKLGWAEEGVRRQAFFLDGSFVDVTLTAQLASEFQTREEFEESAG